MSFKDSMIIGFILFGLWLLIVLHIFSDTAYAADHTIVSFDSPDHLATLQDSVVGVCDTTMEVYSSTIIDEYTPAYHNWNRVIYVDTLRFQDGKPICRIDFELARTVIISRRLVGVTVTEERGIGYRKVCYRAGCYSHIDTMTTPGQAIIFYEEVKCIK